MFPYSGPRSNGGDALFYQALGCTRFRSALMAQCPDLVAGIGIREASGIRPETYRDWRGLDGRIAGYLHQLGHEPHVHWPEVLHHHRYPNGCACGRDHD